MAKDRQWVVLDHSQNAKKDREAAARETAEGDDGAQPGESESDAPKIPGSFAPGE